MARTMSIDFGRINYDRVPMPVRPRRNKQGNMLKMTPKQLRDRIRRSRNGGNHPDQQILYRPVEDWDAEELARGRPKNDKGEFKGRPPHWITRELHEEAISRFRQLVRDGVNANTNIAVETLRDLMTNDEIDEDGKPKVPPSVKASIATYFIDHTLGKPKQRVETDISVKLQGMLASAIITPGMLPAQPDAKSLTSPRDMILDAEWSSEDE